MKPFPKLMKSIDSPLIVLATSGDIDSFEGEAIVGDAENPKGDYCTCWDAVLFNEFDLQAPQSTETPQPEQSPAKDVELRLECLKLAATINQGASCGSGAVIFDAREFYDWITKKEK